ncbi:hypothetical protein NQ317_000287 [Molorchus minor]|uniref:Uncharacterized protein n=1 Tax=Molorchus minor TaxID=1323400 RepID=A0ABQ9JBL2_9CUCU|nr:hypothetical protein NQ317_000287 [Molorchus minor]
MAFDPPAISKTNSKIFCVIAHIEDKLVYMSIHAHNRLASRALNLLHILKPIRNDSKVMGRVRLSTRKIGQLPMQEQNRKMEGEGVNKWT